MFKQGIHTTISTDCPVEPLNPFYNLYCAISRKSIKHIGLSPFLPKEAFALEDAITCYTVTPYYFSYEENNGYEDYIAINQELNEETLLETVVLETYIDGTIVYKKN